MNSFQWKDLKKALHLIFFLFWWKLAHVVSSRDTAYLWDKNSSSNPENPGSTRYSQVRTWEERSTNSGCCSAQGIWETERMCERSFTQSNIDSRRNGSSGKGMKGGYKEAHKTITRNIHFDPLTDGHPYLYISKDLFIIEHSRTDEEFVTEFTVRGFEKWAEFWKWLAPRKMDRIHDELIHYYILGECWKRAIYLKWGNNFVLDEFVQKWWFFKHWWVSREPRSYKFKNLWQWTYFLKRIADSRKDRKVSTGAIINIIVGY